MSVVNNASSCGAAVKARGSGSGVRTLWNLWHVYVAYNTQSTPLRALHNPSGPAKGVCPSWE